MKTNSTPIEVISNVGERGNFTIKANGKAFKVLINGLYADKIQSITREIWSNALDAHAMAGCADRPFEVSFPSTFDPSFRVRDYGVSLSHDQVMHMYTTLFESTKEDTNEQVGKLGLGSKSPFAYTDSFSVTVVLDGVKRFYAAMIGPDDVPAINFMGVEDADEANGVEVSFPVDKADVHTFALAARRVSHGFDVKPLVTNDQGFKGWPEIHPLREGDGWKILTSALEGHRSSAYAKMGCVLYPINANAMGDISDDVRAVLNHPCVIDFAIGDLEITASREELSYGRNDPTRDSILRRVQSILDVLKEEAVAKFANCTSLWEAACLYHAEVKNGALPKFYKDMYKRFATFKGESVDRTFKVLPVRGMDAMYLDAAKMQAKTTTFRETKEIDLAPYKDTTFIFEDCTVPRAIKRVSARMSKWKQSSRVRNAVWIKFYTRESMNAIYRIMDLFDGAAFINIADIEPPHVVREGGGERRPVMARVYASGDFNRVVDLDDEDFEEGGIFVPLERMIPVVPHGARVPATIISNLISVGAIPADLPVYGAPKSLMKKFEGEQWINLYDFAMQWLEENGNDVPAMRMREEALDSIRRDYFLQFLHDYVAVERVHPDSPAAAAQELLRMVREEKATNSNAIRTLATSIGRDIDAEAAEDIYMDLYRETSAAAVAAYPLLHHVHNRASVADNMVDLVTEYVIMADNVSQTNHAAYQIAAE